MADWIGAIYFHPDVVAKLGRKHNVTPGQVRDAVAYGNHATAAWHDDPIYGERLIVKGVDADGIELIAYLRPIDRTDGTWECLTARTL